MLTFDNLPSTVWHLHLFLVMFYCLFIWDLLTFWGSAVHLNTATNKLQLHITQRSNNLSLRGWPVEPLVLILSVSRGLLTFRQAETPPSPPSDSLIVWDNCAPQPLSKYSLIQHAPRPPSVALCLTSSDCWLSVCSLHPTVDVSCDTGDAFARLSASLCGGGRRAGLAAGAWELLLRF